ncbi:MAG: DUF362 domain-containing protein [Candidatus Omnitrophota bacterium]|nr:DUF362 domain-containing protein [Candidatus Omnitrophota bacterium]
MQASELLYKLDCFFKNKMTRRGFLKICLGGLALFVSQNAFLKKAFAKSVSSSGRKKKKVRTAYDIVVAEGKDPAANVRAAITAIGGIERFVSPGDTVVIKPNIGWDRTPEQAANTDPEVVAAVVELAYRAKAKRVNVFDITCNNEKLCYESSGIAKAAREKGAFVYFADNWNVVKASFPYKSPMEGWPVLRDAVECDTFINIPVLKHHMLAGLTMGMKNLMGVCSGTRGLIHVDLGRKLVDLTDFIDPDLTIIDATRVLVRHGPSGGNIEDVEHMNKVIVSAEPVLADVFCAALMGRSPSDIPNLREAAKMGYGRTDISTASIKKIEV